MNIEKLEEQIEEAFAKERAEQEQMITNELKEEEKNEGIRV